MYRLCDGMFETRPGKRRRHRQETVSSISKAALLNVTQTMVQEAGEPKVYASTPSSRVRPEPVQASWVSFPVQWARVASSFEARAMINRIAPVRTVPVGACRGLPHGVSSAAKIWLIRPWESSVARIKASSTKSRLPARTSIESCRTPDRTGQNRTYAKTGNVR